MTRSINILCTRPVDPALVKTAATKNIDIEVQSFIDTAAVTTPAVVEQVRQALQQPATVVFTSMNAVTAVGEQLGGLKPDWNIYSIGTSTDQLVKNYFGEGLIGGTAYNAADLATLIINDRFADEVIFFCGNQRRDELPDMLRKNDIDVMEIEVYQTTALPQRMEKDYDGILFFSPSAVESFFLDNSINEQTILFAIGNTTAESIKEFTNNKIIISTTPGKENLVQQMMAYFEEVR